MVAALRRADAATPRRSTTTRSAGPRSEARAYTQLVQRWAEAWAAWAMAAVLSAVRDNPLTPATHGPERLGRSLRARLHHGAPEVSPRAIAATGRAVVRASILAQHRRLVGLGMPRGYLVGRLDGERRAKDAAHAKRRRGGEVVTHHARTDERSRVRADERDKPKVAPVLSAPGVTRARGTVGIDLLMDGPGERVLVGWAQEGVDLISTLSRKATQDLASLVVEAAAKGRRWEDLADAVAKMGARTEAHARLIARTETARLNSRVSEEMQTAAGVDRFRLRTSGDQRVRDEHAEAAERDIGYGPGIYRWSEGIPNFMGPQTGLPGAVPNCRCTAEPHVLQSTRDAWAKAADL